MLFVGPMSVKAQTQVDLFCNIIILVEEDKGIPNVSKSNKTRDLSYVTRHARKGLRT